MLPEYKAFLLNSSAQWGFPAGGEWSFLFNNNYHPHCTNINLLWFHGRDEFPSVVTKVYREPGILSREFENLQQVHGGAPDLVPRPLHFGQLAGFWTLWMTGLPGSRFPVENKYSPEALRSVVQAVISLHKAVRTPTSDQPDRYRRMVSEPLEAVSGFEDSSAMRKNCEALAAGISPDWIKSLPIVPQHGDFFSGNLLLYRKQWHIVDWESFGLIDLPLYDVLTFFLSLLQAGEGNPETWSPSLAANIPGLVLGYAEQFGLSKEDVALLLPLTLINWFHLQWIDGRRAFATRTYTAIENYFRNPESWERIIVGK